MTKILLNFWHFSTDLQCSESDLDGQIKCQSRYWKSWPDLINLIYFEFELRKKKLHFSNPKFSRERETTISILTSAACSARSKWCVVSVYKYIYKSLWSVYFIFSAGQDIFVRFEWPQKIRNKRLFEKRKISTVNIEAVLASFSF